MTTLEQFPSHACWHTAAKLVEIFDCDGEAAMLSAARELGRPLDENAYIFPDGSLVRYGYKNYRFRDRDDGYSRATVERPASLDICIADPFPEKAGHPAIHEPDGLALYGLLTLYRDFSMDRYCAGWMGFPEHDESLRTEFAQWLRERNLNNRYLGPNMPHRLDSGEEASIPALVSAWHEAAGAGD